MYQPWDKESVHDEKIFPLVAQIIEICKEHQIPFFTTFQLNNNSENPHDDGTNLMCTSVNNDYPHADKPTFNELNRVAHGSVHKSHAFALTISKV